MALEQAREHLAAGKFRKARDAAKILFKHDPDTGRPLLVEANLRLAEEMLANGQNSEAHTVIEYLRTIATPDEMAGLTRKSAATAGDWKSVAAGALEALIAAGETVDEADRNRWADEIVASFEALPPGELADEARSVQNALEAACSSRWEDAKAALRAVSRRSPFAHWTLFIKGLTAFHRGDLGRAGELFARLPVDGVPRLAAAPWRALLEELAGATRQIDADTLDCWLRMAGEPDLTGPLLEAERRWTAGQISASYDALKRASTFSWDGVGLGAQLRESFMSAPHALPDRAAEDWVKSLNSRISRDRALSEREAEEFKRTLIQYDGPTEALYTIDFAVTSYLDHRTKRRGADPSYDACVHVWTGRIFSLPVENWGYSSDGLRWKSGAIERFKLAISLAPDWVEPYLELCRVYDATRQKQERNRLLDEMTARFPNHKETLMLAGRHALERGVCRKAAGFFELARTADPLDASILDSLVEARVGQARAEFEKRGFDKARKRFDEEILPLADDGAGAIRGRWGLLLRRSLLEEIHDSPEAGRPWLEQALLAAPGEGPVWLARLLFHDELTTGSAKKRRLPRSQLKLKDDPAPTLRNFALMLDLIDRWDSNEHGRERPGVFLKRHDGWLTGFLRKALTVPFERPDLTRAFESLYHNDLLEHLARDMVKRLLKQDLKDPLYGLMRLRLDKIESFGFDTPKHLSRLDRLAAEAARRNDREASELIKRERQSIQRQNSMPPPRFDSGFSDDAEDDFDDEDDWDFPPIDANSPDPGPKAHPFELELLLRQLSEASDEDLAQLKKTRPKSMSAAVFDKLAATAKALNSGTGPAPAPPQPKPAPPPDPNQMELF